MDFRSARLTLVTTFIALASAGLPAADTKLSRRDADAFNQKILLIAAQSGATLGGTDARAGMRRTAVTEAELNSWFTYHAQPLFPKGITEPAISIVGEGRVAGRAVVDLDVIAKKNATGGSLDPWSYVGGRMPVRVTGILHSRDGMGRFQLEAAEVSGVPVPKLLLQELLTYYSRTPDHPEGVGLDTPFELPANISRIEVGQGQAVIVQ